MTEGDAESAYIDVHASGPKTQSVLNENYCC